jgi:hypothetical protein
MKKLVNPDRNESRCPKGDERNGLPRGYHSNRAQRRQAEVPGKKAWV